MSQSVRKAITLLRATAAHGDGASVSALARTAGLPRATALRLIQTMEGERLLQRVPDADRRGARSGAAPARAVGGHGRRAARACSRASDEPLRGGARDDHVQRRRRRRRPRRRPPGGRAAAPRRALLDRAALPPPRQLERQGPARELRRGAAGPLPAHSARRADARDDHLGARAAPRARGGPGAGLRRQCRRARGRARERLGGRPRRLRQRWWAS